MLKLSSRAPRTCEEGCSEAQGGDLDHEARGGTVIAEQGFGSGLRV